MSQGWEKAFHLLKKNNNEGFYSKDEKNKWILTRNEEELTRIQENTNCTQKKFQKIRVYK